MENENLYYFEKAPIPKAIAHFSLPMVLGMSMTVVYSILNAYFIGLLNNCEMIAALTLTLPVFSTLMALGNLIGVGGGTYISRLLGEKNMEKIKHVSSFSFYSCIGIGLAVLAASLPFVDQIVQGLGASDASFPFTKSYVFIMLIGAPVVIANFAMEQTVRAEGAANVSLIGMILSVAVNVVLDPLLIFIFDWGVKGAALATLLANAVSVSYYCRYIAKKSPYLSLSLQTFTVNKEILGNVLKIGIPVFLLSILLGIQALFFNHFVSLYGDISVAAYGISSRFQQLPEFIVMGLCEGVVPLIAFCFTADKKRMKAVLTFIAILVSSLASVFGIIVFAISNDLIGLFTVDVQLVEVGSHIIRITFLSLFISGFTLLITGIFQATGQGKAALAMSIIQGLVLIPTLYVANGYWKFEGVVWSLFAADAICALVGSVLLYHLRHRLNPDMEELMEAAA